MNNEVVKDGINGLLVEPKNSNDLAQKMIWAIENKNKMQEMGITNKVISKSYHIESVWPKFMEYVL